MTLSESRIRSKSLRSKVGSVEDAAELIRDGITLCLPAGHQSACPKTFLSMLREEISARNSPINIRLFTTGPAPALVEDLLTLPTVRGRKYGQLTSPGLKEAVNNMIVPFVETRIGFPSYQLQNGCYGKMDLAALEATAITEEGNIIPSTTLLDGPSYVTLADKVVVEINHNLPEEIEGIHDVYLLEAPPSRRPVPITHVSDRIGTPYIPANPDKIALIIESSLPDTASQSSPIDRESEIIASHLLDFLINEVKHGRLPNNLLPLQFGIGAIPTAFARILAKSSLTELEVFSGSVGDGVLDLIDSDKIKAVSAGALYFSEEGFKRFFGALTRYKHHFVLRPAEIAGCPELISRLGIIAMNGAIEIDIYGHVNSTHIFGSKSIGGIGGSCDFVWNAYLSIFLLRSTTAGGKISTIVPMVTHVDHPEHAVDIIVTEQGLADIRGLAPVERARAIIDNCAHPTYRPMLMDYLKESINKAGGHEPHLLREAFSLHAQFIEKIRFPDFYHL